MTVTYGFYNSLSGDRVYDAEDFGSIFDGIIADGIFQSQGGGFGVTQDTGSNMNVKVATGRAWLNGTWTFNDAVLALTVGTADPVLNRIDTVIIEVDSSAAVRANSIKIKAGTAASTPVPPTLTDAGTLHQHPLCDIYVGAGVTAITNANITNRIGTDTPFCTGILETLSVAWLFANWEAQFQDWFDNLVDQLTGVQVTNLQNQIDAHDGHWLNYKNYLINGDMSISVRGTSESGLTSSKYAKAPDRWKFINSGLGTWTAAQSTDAPTGFNHSYSVNCTTADPSPAAGDSIIIGQYLEGQMLDEFLKGTSGAKGMAISFSVKSNITGAFILELYDLDNGRTISAPFAITASATWEKKTVVLPGDTTGAFTHDANSSLLVNIWIGAGSNFTSGTLQTSWGTAVQANRAVGQTNFGASSGNYFRMTGIQLEVNDNVVTDFEYEPYPVTQRRCKRYARLLDQAQSGMAVSGTVGHIIANFDEPMRAAPTIQANTNGNIKNSSGGNVAVTAWALVSATDKSAVLSATVASGLTAGDATYCVGESIILDAEL